MINKKVEDQILELLPPGETLETLVKEYVNGRDCVRYYKNRFDDILVVAYKVDGYVTLLYKG